MKKIILLSLTLFLMLPFAKATHVIGGDLTVRWIGPTQNDYEVQLRVYRSCNRNSFRMPSSVDIKVYDLGGTYAKQKGIKITMTTADRVINTNIPFGDPCFTPVGLCVDEGVFTTAITLPDNPTGNGYFLTYQTRARNAGIDNLLNSGGLGMTFYCEIPNPGEVTTLNNSSPDMGAYPLDAYFCVNSPKQFKFNVTDPDGDSLVYSLVTPLDYDRNNPVPNAAPAFPFDDVPYAAKHSLADMIGGVPMTINPQTGMILANPSKIGTYVFGVKVEEYRNGVKIGETRRDVQYEAQACTSGNPPFFPDPSLVAKQTIQFEYNKESCRDLIIQDLNSADTIYIELVSPILPALGAYLVDKTPNANDTLTYYTNWLGGSSPTNGTYIDSILADTNYYDPILKLPFNEGVIGQRFCWTPQCDQVGQTFPFQVNGFSTGCDGISLDSLPFFIEVVPPTANLIKIANKEIAYGEEYCRNIVFKDTTLADLLNLTTESDIFSLGATFPSVSNNYVYDIFEDPSLNVSTGVPNDAENTKELGTRFCWTPDCEHIGGTFKVQSVLTSVDCPGALEPDTMSFNLIVTPPYDSLDVIPNVITPNGDGINDFYSFGWVDDLGVRHGGTSNYCNDEITIEIFNRWGNSVFHSEEPSFEWRGTNKGGGDVPPGTYFVLVTGTYGSETITLEQRTVTVLR